MPGRYVAKNIVAAGLASRCLIQVSYAIGVARPTSVMVNTFGTGRVSDAEITKLVLEHFDLRPKGIIQMLDLLRPIYEKTAAYGHFGREEPEFSWESADKALVLAEAAGTEPVVQRRVRHSFATGGTKNRRASRSPVFFSSARKRCRCGAVLALA